MPVYRPVKGHAAENARRIVCAKPEWVSREIDNAELSILAYWIERTGAKTAAELGVASGFSAAAIYEAMKVNSSNPNVYSFDLSEDYYVDESRRTGAAFAEIHGSNDGFHLEVGKTSSCVADLPKLDFLFDRLRFPDTGTKQEHHASGRVLASPEPLASQR